MFTFNVDLGQVIIVGALAIVGFFIKKEVNSLNTRLDKHDGLILKLVSDVQRLIGINFVRFHKRDTDIE